MVHYDFDTKTLVGDEPAPIYNPKVSLGHVIIHHLNKFPENVFQICADDGVEVSCGEIARLSKNFAKNLLKKGITQGDVVGIVGKNSTFVTPVIFGCFLIAAPISPIDSKWDDFTITYEITEPKIIFCDDNVAESVRNYVASTKRKVDVITLTKKIVGFQHISDYLEEVDNVQIPLIMQAETPETVAAMLCTSGTTGVGSSKIAKLSHAQLIDSKMLYGDSNNIFGFIYATFSWITGLGLMVFCALNHEKRLFTSSDFSPDMFFDMLEKFKFSHLTGTPAMYRLLEQSARFDKVDFSCIKRFLVGGLHCSIEMRESMKSKMPNAYLMMVYGMTEALTNCVTGEKDLFSMSVGKPFSDARFRILLADGTFGGLNDIGEILTKKPGKPFLGYVKNPTFTANALDDDGWLHTGDLGFIDDQLNLTIVGRKSFVIQRKLKLVFPTEIEDILDKVSGVKASCVIGIPDEDSGDELPTAFIIKDEAAAVSAKTIHDAIEHLEDFKQLSGGVHFMETFLKSATGKILRFKMKEMGIELKKSREL